MKVLASSMNSFILSKASSFTDMECFRSSSNLANRSMDHINREGEYRDGHEDKEPKGIGDNMKDSSIAPIESSSLPSAIKNLPAINFVVDLNDNMFDTYGSQEMVGDSVDVSINVNKKETFDDQDKSETHQ
ncbi:hypothetical protein K7X08_000452 [Anisodus acutangulus]|uniref:Uncharacterized protein n=1 Tax=Anisodus acutangulus TaxID=402998 RepID=A0A9Q1M8G9_9SOLA|nr:hypothetical protein K7X08_000452 [Anisodus acutangulus]